MSDDTTAIQSALDAASAGGTVLGDSGAVYVISDTLTFSTDRVTLDLQGASIRIGGRAPGSPLAANDTMFAVSDRNGVRITNGSILRALSPYRGGTLPYRIQLAGGHGCQIDHVTADCEGSMFAYVLGTSHAITDNTIANGGIGGFGCNGVSVRGNSLTDSPYNALGFTGFSHAPCVGNQYLDNVISGHGLTAIEEHSPDGPQYNSAALIRGNAIGPPAPGASGRTAISAVGVGATVERNTIQEATGYAIEVSGMRNNVLNNRITWAAPATNGVPAIVVNQSAPGTAYSAVVQRNVIFNSYIGIATAAQPWLAPLDVSRNTIVDPVSTGLALCPPSGRISAVICKANKVTFSSRPTIGTRIGIKTTANARISGNRVSYTTRSYAADVYDVPLQFVGDNVALTNNLIDGGGRTDGYIYSGVLGGSWTGWSLVSNSFIRGAPAKLGGLVAPTVRHNKGLS